MSLLERVYHWQPTRSGLMVASVERPAKPLELPTAMDLFAGAGGFSLGMHQAGWHVIAAAEWDVLCAKTYLCNLGSPATVVHVGMSPAPDASRRDERFFAEQAGAARPAGELALFEGAGTGWISNHPEGEHLPCEHLWLCDVRELDGPQILETLGIQIGDLGCVVGGPPCQGFSRANSKASKDDPRNQLVFEFARLVCELRPKAMAMENVPQIVSMTTPEGIPVVDALARVLEDGEFGVYEALRRSILSTAGLGAAVRGKSRREVVDDEDDEAEDDAQLSLAVA